MAIPVITASSGGGGGDPVAGSCDAEAAGVGEGVVVAADVHDVGIGPAVRLTGKCFDASAVNACVVDSASGAAVCDEAGRENPRPPFSN